MVALARARSIGAGLPDGVVAAQEISSWDEAVKRTCTWRGWPSVIVYGPAVCGPLPLLKNDTDIVSPAARVSSLGMPIVADIEPYPVTT